MERFRTLLQDTTVKGWTPGLRDLKNFYFVVPENLKYTRILAKVS